jgi:hypothetical protein
MEQSRDCTQAENIRLREERDGYYAKKAYLYKLEAENAALTARVEELEEALKQIVKDDCNNEWEEGAMRMHYIARDALGKEIK